VSTGISQTIVGVTQRATSKLNGDKCDSS